MQALPEWTLKKVKDYLITRTLTGPGGKMDLGSQQGGIVAFDDSPDVLWEAAEWDTIPKQEQNPKQCFKAKFQSKAFKHSFASRVLNSRRRGKVVKQGPQVRFPRKVPRTGPSKVPKNRLLMLPGTAAELPKQDPE